MIRIAIAEDNDSLARAIHEKLELFEEEIEVAFRACDGRELQEMLAGDHTPNVILMDIEMPVMDGITATEIIREKYPQIKIIMLTVFDDEERIFNSIQAGANGYLLKEEPPDKIYEGIKMILEGGAPMSPVIAAKSLQLLRDPSRIEKREEDPEIKLSKRETEVLAQLSSGLNYKEIAENLFISPFTVRKHIENIYKILHVNSKMQAVNKAQKYKLI